MKKETGQMEWGKETLAQDRQEERDALSGCRIKADGSGFKGTMTTICEVDGNGLMTKAGHLTGLTYKLELLMRVSEDARRTKHFL